MVNGHLVFLLCLGAFKVTKICMLHYFSYSGSVFANQSGPWATRVIG